MKKIIILLFLFLSGYLAVAYFNRPAQSTLDFTREKIVLLDDNGLGFTISTSTSTIADFLQAHKITLNNHDQIIPGKDAALFPGENIQIRRAVKIRIAVDGNTIENYTLQNSALGAISENNIKLGRLDKISPDINMVLQNNSTVTITRINIEEKVIPEDIDFKTIANTDSKMGWREKKTTQVGVKGVREVKYRITYKNGQEVSRVALEKNIITQPTPEIITQGTYMQLGKAAKGQGTWYAFKGGLFAASTTLPRDSFARVTNTANGKSVVVQINDYGPQGKGRIIDLDKVAFQKIAGLGAGVIGVKVEPVLN
jgi:hypothetical protein